jgi:hypothetical protein
MDEHYPAKVIDHFISDIKDTLIDIKETTTSSIDSLNKTITGHNGRLKRVEQFMWAFGGGMAVVTALVLPLMFYYITQLEKKIDLIDNKTIQL